MLQAAGDLLMEVGYDAMSYDDVARRAGVHRTTVYRRWPTKPELVADAVGLHTDQHVPIPDTGSFATDLMVLVKSVAANIGSEGGARRSRSIVAAATPSAQLDSSGKGTAYAGMTSTQSTLSAQSGSSQSIQPSPSLSISSEQLAEAVHVFMTDRIERSEPIVERAVARGELPEGIDPRVAIEPAVGAVWFRLLLTGEPIDDEFVEQVAALVASGAGAFRA